MDPSQAGITQVPLGAYVDVCCWLPIINKGYVLGPRNVLTFEERYSRQILFPGIGREGQQRLSEGRVAVVGCGATGSASATLLARAGVGYLRIIDRDFVEASNLQRQSLFDEGDATASLPKAIADANKIRAFNSEIVVDAEVADLTPANVQRLIGGTDIFLDGTDNFETRYLLNDFAVCRNQPWIYAGAVGSYSITLNILPAETACLACIFPEPPRGNLQTCDTAGILNMATSHVASIQAAEAIKFLVGARNQMRRTLVSFDIWSNQRSEVQAGRPNPGCRVCANREFVHLSGKGRPNITLCGRNSVQIHEHQRAVDFGEMSDRLSAHGKVQYNDFVLKFWYERYELTLFRDGRAIIRGTTDIAAARSIYSRFIGS